MFYDCRGLKYCNGWDPIANQQIKSVTNLFKTCTNLISTDFKIPENLYYDTETGEIDLNGMFYQNYKHIPTSIINTIPVRFPLNSIINIKQMLIGCKLLEYNNMGEQFIRFENKLWRK